MPLDAVRAGLDHDEKRRSKMKPYREMSREELLQLKAELEARYQEVQAQNLHLDMSRGKPSAEQLDISMGMMDVLNSGVDLKDSEGVDCRNYGILDGIKEGVLRRCGPEDPDGRWQGCVAQRYPWKTGSPWARRC